MKTKKDIYGTEYTVQATASDYFRIDLRKKAHKDTECISLDYKMTKDLYKELHSYLEDRGLLPKPKKTKIKKKNENKSKKTKTENSRI